MLNIGCKNQQQQYKKGFNDSSLSNKKIKIINQLYREALTSFVRLPYALSLEQWRYEILNGNIMMKMIPTSNFTTSHLNKKMIMNKLNQRYWQIRSTIQGIGPPSTPFMNDYPKMMMEQNRLDPLSKYHVLNFVPYLRYFFATFFAHQMHETICGGGDGNDSGNSTSTSESRMFSYYYCCPGKQMMDRFR